MTRLSTLRPLPRSFPARRQAVLRNALRALDDNRDGELTGGELGGLALWRDENRNGVSDPGEVIPANVHGVAALAVRGDPTRPGLITAQNGVRFDDGRTRPLYDWTPGLGRTPVS